MHFFNTSYNMPKVSERFGIKSLHVGEGPLAPPGRGVACHGQDWLAWAIVWDEILKSQWVVDLDRSCLSNSMLFISKKLVSHENRSWIWSIYVLQLVGPSSVYKPIMQWLCFSDLTFRCTQQVGHCKDVLQFFSEVGNKCTLLWHFQSSTIIRIIMPTDYRHPEKLVRQLSLYCLVDEVVLQAENRPWKKITLFGCFFFLGGVGPNISFFPPTFKNCWLFDPMTTGNQTFIFQTKWTVLSAQLCLAKS